MKCQEITQSMEYIDSYVYTRITLLVGPFSKEAAEKAFHAFFISRLDLLLSNTGFSNIIQGESLSDFGNRWRALTYQNINNF